MASQTIFTKIVAGEIPSWKLYEDEHVFAFLDIGPLSPGHALLIPRQAYETLDELPDDVAAALGRALPRLGRAVREATGAAGYNVLQNNGAVSGQQVPHVHFHIIPRQADDGLGYRWHPQSLDEDQARALQRKIVDALGE